jgi:tetratricopeptide (TPR) repeat protein
LSGPHDLFISHDPASTAQVKRLTAALAACGVSCFACEGGDSPSLQPRLATCKALLIWASEDFFRSRGGQTQLAMAYIAHRQEPSSSPDRIVVVNALPTLKHIYPLHLRSRVIGQAPELADTPDFARLAEKLREHCAGLSGTLGSLYPAAFGGWREPYDSLSHIPVHFAGRERELWDIHDALTPHNTNPTTHKTDRMIVVSGAAGQGKSFLAREYAFRFGAAYPGGIFRLTARDAQPAASLGELSENPALKPQLLALLRQLCPDSPLDDATNLVTVRETIEVTLTASGKPFLWIIDDIPDGINGPALMQWLAPDHSGRWGRTLAISRSQRYDRRAESIHLPILDEQAGVSLLTRGKPPGKTDDEQEAAWLVAEVGRHARFVAMAAGLAESPRRHRRYGYSGLLHRIEKQNKLAAEFAGEHPGEFPEGHERTTAALLLDAIHALDLPARNILLLAAQLAEYPLPIDFIAECFVLNGMSADDRKEDLFTVFLNEPPEEPMTLEAARAYVEKGATCLEHFALADRTDGSLNLYPAAINAIARLAPNPAKQDALREAALEALYVAAESCVASGDWRRLAVIAPHGRLLIDDLRERLIAPDDTASEITGRIRLTLCLADMDLNLGARRRAIQLYRAASAYLIRAMATDPHNGSRHRDFARVQEQLGDLMADQGDMTSALEHYRKSLGVRSFMAKQDPAGMEQGEDLLRHHTKMGKILIARNDIEEALQSYRAAHGIAVRRARETPDDIELQFSLAASHERLAGLHTRLNDPAAAMSALEQALPVFEKLAETRPTEVRFVRSPVAVHNMMGNLLRARDDLSGALNRYRLALAIAENAARLDPCSPETQREVALCHDHIGDTLTGLDDPGEAEAYYLACLTIAENPANQPAFAGIRQRDIAVVQIKLGMVKERAQDTEAALFRYLNARSQIEKLAIDLPDNDALRQDLAWLRKKLDRLHERKAAELRRRARESA